MFIFSTALCNLDICNSEFLVVDRNVVAYGIPVNLFFVCNFSTVFSVLELFFHPFEK